MTNIYIIENNTNDVVYIGQTKSPLLKRFSEHIVASYKPNVSKKLYVAMQKIGQENFTYRLLETCSDEDANNRENYYIDLYKNNYNQHYNFPLSKSELEKELKEHSSREICRKYKLHDKSLVLRWAKIYGIAIDKNRFNNNPLNDSTLLYEEYVINNLSVSQLAKKYNFKSCTSIKNRLRQFGIKKLTINKSNSVKPLTGDAEGNTEPSL